MYERYITSKIGTDLDYTWRQGIRSDITSGKFKEFVSGNSQAKQFVIFTITQAGLEPVVKSLGCGMHKITIYNSSNEPVGTPAKPSK